MNFKNKLFLYTIIVLSTYYNELYSKENINNQTSSTNTSTSNNQVSVINTSTNNNQTITIDQTNNNIINKTNQENVPTANDNKASQNIMETNNKINNKSSKEIMETSNKNCENNKTELVNSNSSTENIPTQTNITNNIENNKNAIQNNNTSNNNASEQELNDTINELKENNTNTENIVNEIVTDNNNNELKPNTNINTNEQTIKQLLNDIVQLIINKKSYRVISNYILPLWDRTIICCTDNNLITKGQLINIWSDLYNTYRNAIIDNFNKLKQIDSDFKDEILNSKILDIEKAKLFINNGKK